MIGAPALGMPVAARDASIAGTSYDNSLRVVECIMLRSALERARINLRTAADLLGLTHHRFHRLYRKQTDESGE